MNYFLYIILFIFGSAVGSFLNVISLRYRPGQKLLDKKIIGGRSYCLFCHKQLIWYELIPVLSFFLQKRRCRSCGRKLSFQYPLIEILSGLIFVIIPWHLGNLYKINQLSFLGESINWYYWLALIWILIFLLFLLLFVIDLRYLVIPNQINLTLAVLGLLLIAIVGYYHKFDSISSPLLRHYAIIFGLRDNFLINHLFAVLSGTAFFGAIIFLSRGKAMGWGDFKLVASLGLIFEWPDILMALILAFLTGALVSIIFLIKRKKKIKDAVPFGPFLAVGASLTFFFGYQIINWYFGLFNL